MNRSLLTSVHAIFVAVVVVGLAAIAIVGGFEFGRSSDGSRGYLIWSGWAALLLFAIAYAYVLRKYAHRVGYSPEFRRQVPKAAMEDADERIGALRDQIAAGVLTDDGDIKREARKAIVASGCAKVLRVELERDAAGGVILVMRRTEPIGRTARWMHAHLYYGAGAGALTFFHGGGSFASPMGILLNGLTFLVVGTGFIGLAFWIWGPLWLTKKEGDLSVEEAYALDRHYKRRLRLQLSADGGGDREITKLVQSVDATDMGQLLQGADKEGSGVSSADIRTLTGQHERVRGELRRLMRAKFLMNAWRLVHIPASIVLLAVIVAHVLSVWFY